MKCYALLPYVTKRTEDASIREKRCRELVYAFKNLRGARKCYRGPSRSYEDILGYLESQFRSLPGVSSRTLYVPVPSSRATDETALLKWPAFDLASKLNGGICKVYLRRTKSIQKSSRTDDEDLDPDLEPNDRSLDVHARTLEFPFSIDAQWNKVCLVDDCVTYGGTLLGAEKAIRKAGFNGDIIGATAAFTVSKDMERDRTNAAFYLKEGGGPKKYRTPEGWWLY